MDIKINGVAYDQSSVIFEAKGKQYITVQDISFGSSLKPNELRGNATEVIAITAGEGAHKLSYSMGKEEADEYLADLGDGYGRVVHDVVIRFKADGSPETKYEGIGCRITDDSTDIKGADAVLTKFEMYVMRAKKNGLSITGEA